MDKKELLKKLMEVDIKREDKYMDEFSGIEFNIQVDFDLNSMVKDYKRSEVDIGNYNKLVVDEVIYTIENEVVEMCYRCYQHITEPKFEMEDWLLLSLSRGDLIMVLSGKIAELTVGQLKEKN